MTDVYPTGWAFVDFATYRPNGLAKVKCSGCSDTAPRSKISSAKHQSVAGNQDFEARDTAPEFSLRPEFVSQETQIQRKEPADSGKYVMCLKRQRDGSWKLTADIWNQSGDDEEDDDASPSPSIS